MIADHDITLDKGIRTNVTVIADDSPFENDSKLPNARIQPNFR